MQTIVIGHRNPDMDSICAAIGCAELKRLSGWQDVIAADFTPQQIAAAETLAAEKYATRAWTMRI